MFVTWKLKSMGYRPKADEPAVVRTWAEERTPQGTELTVPRGGLGRVREALRVHGVPFRLRDERTLGDPEWRGRQPDYQGYELRDYQVEAVAAMRAALEGTRGRCVLDQACSTGKTRAALTAFAERRKNGAGPAIVLAPKSILKVAWGADIVETVPEDVVELPVHLTVVDGRVAHRAD